MNVKQRKAQRAVFAAISQVISPNRPEAMNFMKWWKEFEFRAKTGRLPMFLPERYHFGFNRELGVSPNIPFTFEGQKLHFFPTEEKDGYWINYI